MKTKILSTSLIILIISAVFCGSMVALNLLTGPMIEANNAGAEFAPLLAVMPEGAQFDGEALIYDKDNASSTLANIPTSVLSIYKEKNGLGYVVRTTAYTDFTTSPLIATIGVTSDGNICGIQIDSYGDASGSNYNNRLNATYLDKYIGKDSALSGVDAVSGATISSNAFKAAVEEALGALISNNLITAGVKSDAQILEELVSVVAPGFVKLADVSASGNIKKAIKAGNDAGFAYIMTEGENSYLAVVNAMGVCKIYNVEGVDVTADHEALVTEAKAHASANQKDYVSSLRTKVIKTMSGATNFENLSIDTFNTVVATLRFQHDGSTYYAFYARSFGFDQMDVYVIVDANGAIVKLDAKTLIFGTDHFHGYQFPGNSEGSYKNGFIGQTGDTWTGDQAIITGATMTSNAMKEAVTDAFAAFDSIITNEGGEQ